MMVRAWQPPTSPTNGQDDALADYAASMLNMQLWERVRVLQTDADGSGWWWCEKVVAVPDGTQEPERGYLPASCLRQQLEFENRVMSPSMMRSPGLVSHSGQSLAPPGIVTDGPAQGFAAGSPTSGMRSPTRQWQQFQRSPSSQTRRTVEGADGEGVSSFQGQTSPDAGGLPGSSRAAQVLFRSIAAGNVEAMADAFAFGAHAESSRNAQGQTPMVHAALRTPPSRVPAIVMLLLEQGASVNTPDRTGCVPLHHAAGRGRTTACRALLEIGADVNALDQQYRTPLHCAARSGQVECAQLLLEYGADIKAHELEVWAGGHEGSADPEDRTPRGRSPLIEALASPTPNLELARILLNAGCSALSRDPTNSSASVLHYAACIGAERNPAALTRDAESTTHLEDRPSEVEALEFIEEIALRHPDCMNCVDNKGNTALHWAFHYGAPGNMVRTLIENGAVMDLVNHDGKAALDMNPDLVW